ncbi:hypothetical protein IF129_17340 [Streptomyces chumphonensis]|uniref:Flp pilus assembly protein RcpC/CpaB domain-containing protein n=1 Tax=Streptomyces chumphonensis TaxID=1214925 RepID=A0A927F185_9ACTN|nr:hypothetical protein [Streptomyces chumphonensis]
MAPPDPPTDVPPTATVPSFPPVRAGGLLRHRLRTGLRRARRTAAAGLGAAAVLLVALGPPGGDDRPRAGDGGRPSDAGDRAVAVGAAGSVAGASAEAGDGRPPDDALVRAPVRLADPGVVRLLKPGDRVDVLAGPAPESPGADASAATGSADVLATRARVVAVPDPGVPDSEGSATPSVPGGALAWDGVAEGAAGGVAPTLAGSGALVVLSVPRSIAAHLVGRAAEGSPLAVTLW